MELKAAREADQNELLELKAAERRPDVTWFLWICKLQARKIWYTRPMARNPRYATATRAEARLPS